MFAIDGCKISSNASKEWSGTFEELERKESKLRHASQRILARHQAQDELSDDEINHDLKQKEKLDNSADKIKQFLETHEEKLGARGTPVKSNITDPESAKMTTSKGTIQGYNGIAISDDTHQIILYASTCGSVGEQQTLKPAVEALNKQFKKLGTSNTFNHAKFTADSGFHSEDNLKYLATTGLNSYIADTGFRSRNPLFTQSATYPKEKEKNRKKRSKIKQRRFIPADFDFNKTHLTCICPAGNSMWLSSKQSKIKDKLYYRFEGYLKHCRNCDVRKRCMQKEVKSHGRQVVFLHDKSVQKQNFSDQMKEKIDSASGRREYSK